MTAILCAEVVGYSRLIGDDEEATLATLTAYRKVFVSKIKAHRGRVVDAKGDAILAEFASVVDAVNSSVEIQRELAERNAEITDDRRMDFRIGINLGEVMVKGEEIYGDGVNVAARLEALAEAGRIFISRPVHDQVKSKLKLEYEYLGEQQAINADGGGVGGSGVWIGGEPAGTLVQIREFR
ncbi:MAG: adenylate/guanylate cyclase domain-containing protein [SAR324 cluster bacterium]|nr:adenylate/guanylate cyclase domain-containing protein [SAR324 cluster bacterium]